MVSNAKIFEVEERIRRSLATGRKLDALYADHFHDADKEPEAWREALEALVALHYRGYLDMTREPLDDGHEKVTFKISAAWRRAMEGNKK